jgi:outer membrane protein TolC
MGRTAAAQSDTAAAEPLRLATVQEDAARADPRRRQLELLAAQADLRLRSIDAERLPSFTGESQAQHQSDVVTFPFPTTNGRDVSSPPRNTYDLHVSADQRLLDPTAGPRREVERAQLKEAQARVEVTRFGLRQEVNEAFFAATLLQERMGVLAAAITDLEARLRDASARVEEGMALPGEAASVEATLLQRRQDHAELRARRRAALARLEVLTARSLTDETVLALPDLAGAVEQARRAEEQPRVRPEYEQFARTRERLASQEQVVAAGKRPRLSAYGRAGYGRPGLDFVSDEFDAYWLAGVRLHWAPWKWGSDRREREVLALQREIVAADERAFTEGLRRGVQPDLADIDRLDEALALDERIVGLREAIEGETRARFEEGVVTAAEYVDRHTDVLEARLALAAHRVERALAGARYLTTLGLEVR